MSLINTKIKPFKNQAFKNGDFVEITEKDTEGRWSVFFFYPADFTFVCPTELGDVADHYEELQKLGGSVRCFSPRRSVPGEMERRRRDSGSFFRSRRQDLSLFKPGGAALARAYKTVGRVNEVPPGNQWAHLRPFHSNTMMQVAFRQPG